MSRIALTRRLLNSAARFSTKGAAAMAVATLAGCSADIGRFDFPSSSYTSRSGPTGSIPAPSESTARRGAGLGNEDLAARPPAPYASGPAPIAPAPYAGRDAGTRVAGLHDTTRPPVVGAPAPIAPPPPVRPMPAVAGATMEVQPGDTLSSIALRHRSSISELMTINGLTSPSIRPGQRLTIPAGRRSPRTKAPTSVAHDRAPTAPAPYEPSGAHARRSIAAASPAMTASPPPMAEASAFAADGMSYTVKPGDSLYAIARKHKITFTRLQQANGITDPTKLKPGSVIIIPGAPPRVARLTPAFRSTPAPMPAAAPPPPPTPMAAAPGSESLTAPSGARLIVLNRDALTPAPQAPPGPRVAALGDTMVPPITLTPSEPRAAAPAPAPAPTVAALPAAPIVTAPMPSSAGTTPFKFRWPVKGRVIGSFGARPDATHSDGIKISVPVGAEVAAAEGGVVAYAGSELKGYGNLILIRHENNWVTAYAHNEELLVQRGDKVRRGQTIAKAGKTGNVDQPQLHFELRQGARPVDPLPYLEPL